MTLKGAVSVDCCSQGIDQNDFSKIVKGELGVERRGNFFKDLAAKGGT